MKTTDVTKLPLNHDIREATRAKNESNEADEEEPPEVFRTDYKPLKYVVNKVHLDFALEPGKAVITSELWIEKNPKFDAESSDNDDGDDDVLVLDGNEMYVSLWSISRNGQELTRDQEYSLEPGKLVLKSPQPGTKIQILVSIIPEENTILEGLYKSDDMYVTQCEAEGFRSITYFPDRPDNMAFYERVRIEASSKDYPVLLSNGNLVEEGKLSNDRHYTIWSDPFPKPSYLFALVAGDLAYIEDSYITQFNKRHVQLKIYSKAKYVNKLQHAMNSLKKAMKWDEDTFGLEYDLELFNIVAADDFNAGAMENKSLNIFNVAYILADQETATDDDFEDVENVVGHEYFHNWTGNRITCRDWFQLTLKEGLTVYRDQRFSGDMNSFAVKHIDTVRSLRAGQFREDSGPMKHPIRPESYSSMDNFYTATVYSKGAEVIRMYETLLTTEGFRKGMDLYIKRFDGCAVTCEDFLKAMADANGADLSQFSLWYFTAGTPTVKYSSSYSAEAGVFSLTLEQESENDKPLHIPIATGLLDKASAAEIVPTTVLELKQFKQTFEFKDIKGDVVPSMLRGFSAPVRLKPANSEPDEAYLAFLAAHDTDPFNIWESGQELYSALILKRIREQPTEEIFEHVCQVIDRIISQKDPNLDYGLQSYALVLPLEASIAEEMDIIDFTAIHKARTSIRVDLARRFEAKMKERYEQVTREIQESTGGKFSVDATSIQQRHLRNVILQYLTSIRETPEEQRKAAELAMSHFTAAKCMSDKKSALLALASMQGEGAIARDQAMKQFYDEAKGYNLVVDKWFSIQSGADLPDVLDRVKKLVQHPEFTLKRPNRAKSVIDAFTMNYPAFHDKNGAGYAFVGEMLGKLDRINPKASAEICARRFIQWKRYDENRGLLLKAELLKLKHLKPKISIDLNEVVTKALKE